MAKKTSITSTKAAKNAGAKPVAAKAVLTGGNPQIVGRNKRSALRRPASIALTVKRRNAFRCAPLTALYGPPRASLRPLPPRASKYKHVRYLDIHEDDPLDEAQLGDWVKQASLLPAECEREVLCPCTACCQEAQTASYPRTLTHGAKNSIMHGAVYFTGLQACPRE
jgi:hypothetical protein